MFKTKKDMYNASLFDKRVYVNGETAIKPYYYLRNGRIHIRYTVDRCMRLSESEESRLKEKITASPEKKQEILSDEWNFFSNTVKKDIIYDGIAEAGKIIRERKIGHQD